MISVYYLISLTFLFFKRWEILGFFRKNEIWRVHFRYIVTKIEHISGHEKKSPALKIYYIELKIELKKDAEDFCRF
jgi:hypothetical protein